VAGEKIAAQALDRNLPGEFFDVEYTIPEALTRDRKKVAVKFVAEPGAIAGGLFGLCVLRADSAPADKAKP